MALIVAAAELLHASPAPAWPTRLTAGWDGRRGATPEAGSPLRLATGDGLARCRILSGAAGKLA